MTRAIGKMKAPRKIPPNVSREIGLTILYVAFVAFSWLFLSWSVKAQSQPVKGGQGKRVKM
jgi:hypothetical protein